MIKLLTIVALSVSLFANDIITKESDFTVNETINNIKNIVKAKGFGVFAIIDHKANGKTVDMSLNETKVIIFGNPKVGTRLMQEDISIALDLPLRMLVYKDTDGKVKLSYRDGSWIKSHHNLQSKNLTNKVNAGMDKISDKARLKVN